MEFMKIMPIMRNICEVFLVHMLDQILNYHWSREANSTIDWGKGYFAQLEIYQDQKPENNKEGKQHGD